MLSVSFIRQSSVNLLFLSLLFLLVCVAEGSTTGWREEVFAGVTQYRDRGDCIEATANGTASGLVREQRIQIDASSRLQWSWRAASWPEWPPVAEQSKAGDDFIARVYVIWKSRLPWRSRAINYVWSRQYPAGTSWPNPYASQAMMVAVQGPSAELGQWHHFSRDIQADFQRYHGIEVNRVDALAIMTDADNTGSQAVACYRLPEIVKE